MKTNAQRLTSWCLSDEEIFDTGANQVIRVNLREEIVTIESSWCYLSVLFLSVKCKLYTLYSSHNVI